MHARLLANDYPFILQILVGLSEMDIPLNWICSKQEEN
jgi:hypothetical protein